MNEDYSKYINTGLFYSLFCKKWEQIFFENDMFNIINNINKNNSYVLDFGCGPGIMSKYFNNYIGVDIDNTRINQAKSLYKNKKFKTIKLIDNKNKLDFKSNSIDIVLINDCLHHISDNDMKLILSELNRILKINGSIIIREPIKDTNFLTYLITEMCENGNYVRNRNDYKKIFNSFNIVYENTSNISVRNYLTLLCNKTSNNNNIEFKINTISNSRKYIDVFTFTTFLLSMFGMYIYWPL